MARVLCFALSLPLLARAAACVGGHCDSQVAGRVLLQSSSSRQLEVRKASATDDMTEKVQAMIQDVVSSQRSVTGPEQVAIDMMKTILANITIPAIEQGHDDDQTLMTGAYQSVVNCNDNLAADSVHVSHMASVRDNKSADHKGCRSTEAGLATENGTKWQALSSLVAGLEPLTMPTGVLGLESFFEQGLTWFTTHNASYSRAKSAYILAKQNVETKQSICNGEQTAVEIIYCEWASMASTAYESHERCWNQSSQSFSTTQVTVTDSSSQRQAEYAATKKLLCYLDVLSGDVQGIQDRLETCKNMVVDTDFLEPCSKTSCPLTLVNTSLPAKSDSTHLGDFSEIPGDAAWAANEYSGIDALSATAPVMACAGTDPSPTAQ